MAEHPRLLLHGSALWWQDEYSTSLLSDLASWKAAVCSLCLQTRCSHHSPQGKFSSHSVISAFDYRTPSFQGCSSKHLQESNPERHCNLILALFLGFKSLKWNPLILASSFQDLENFKKIKK